jgi:amidase
MQGTSRPATPHPAGGHSRALSWTTLGRVALTTIAEQTRWLDATAQAELVESGQLSALELLEAVIERIEVLDEPINAVVMRWFDHAREVAAAPVAGVFAGVPSLLKDWMAHYAGQRLCNANRALQQEGSPSAADTTVVRRFKAAGLVIAGRSNGPRGREPGHHRARGVGRHREPVEPGALARGLQRRRCRRGRGGDGGDHARQRRRGVDPHPRVVLRGGRPQAQPGPGQRGTDVRRSRGPLHRGSAGPDRARRGGPARRPRRPRGR